MKNLQKRFTYAVVTFHLYVMFVDTLQVVIIGHSNMIRMVIIKMVMTLVGMIGVVLMRRGMIVKDMMRVE